MHAHVQRRERHANGRGRRDDDGAREDRQLQVDLRQRPSGARNANRVLAWVARFNPGRSRTIVVTTPILVVVIVVVIVVVTVVVIVDGLGRRTLVMVVPV
jgi:hypothetical protein